MIAIGYSSLSFAIVALCIFAAPAVGQGRPPAQLLQVDGVGAGEAEDCFGSSVAISQDTIIVGAYFDRVGRNYRQGSAHVYRWTGSQWIWEATLVAPDGVPNDNFGVSVALSGDTAVIGANHISQGSDNAQGTAYVFVREGTSWTLQARLVASDRAASDHFGGAVAVFGNTAIIGAGGKSIGGNGNQGAVYVFARTGTTWSQEARLTASDGATSDFFGDAVALSSSVVVVGAFGDDVATNIDQGSVYVFARSDTGWTQQAKLTATDGEARDRFGGSVALSSNTIFVGAFTDDVNTYVDQGSAYVFAPSGVTWTQQAHLTAVVGRPNDWFGIDIAACNDRVIVGAFWDNVSGRISQGSASTFVRSGATWHPESFLTAPDGTADDRFGFAVAISESTAVSGAYWDTIDGLARQGSAWVYDLLPACPADLDDDGTVSIANRDYAVSIEDLLFFLSAFEANDIAADLDNGTFTGTRDGGVDISDLLFFLERFEAGC